MSNIKTAGELYVKGPEILTDCVQMHFDCFSKKNS